MLTKGGLALFVFLIKWLFIISESIFKFSWCHACISFYFWWGLVCSDCGLVHYILASTGTICGAGAILFFSTVTRGVNDSLLAQEFLIVCGNYFLHVRCSSVWHFDSVFVDYFSEGVFSGKMGLQQLEEYLTHPSFDIFWIGWVPPYNIVSLPILIFLCFWFGLGCVKIWNCLKVDSLSIDETDWL